MSLHLEPEQQSMRPRIVCRNGRFYLELGWSGHLEALDEVTAFAMFAEADEARTAYWRWQRFGPKAVQHEPD